MENRTQRIKREATLEVINEFEKEIKYVKENEKYDDFNPIVDIDLCKDVLNIIKLQNEKIKEFDAKLTIQQELIDYQKVEIERLELECYKLYPKGSAYSMQIEASDRLEHQIKSEAIKELAKKLEYFVLNEDIEVVKPKCKDYESYINGANQFRHQIKNGINNLVKEITE